MIYYYKKFIDKYGIIYSVDMLRITFKFNMDTYIKHKDGSVERVLGRDYFSQYLQHLADYDTDYEITHYDNFKAWGYRHLYVVACNEWSSTLSVGFERGTRKEDALHGFIEFNPNKVNGRLLNALYAVLRDCVREFHLKRYDLAIDFECARSLCRLDINGLHSYELHFDNGSYTEYTGVRNSVGRVKLYDKQAESKLDYALSRLEYTLDASVDVNSMPAVLITAFQPSIDFELENLRGVEKALVGCLVEMDAPSRNRHLKDLNRRARKKIEPFLSETALVLDVACCRSCLDFALSYTL